MYKIRRIIAIALILSLVLMIQGCGKQQQVNTGRNGSNQNNPEEGTDTPIVFVPSDPKGNTANNPGTDEKKPGGTSTPIPSESATPAPNAPTPTPDMDEEGMWVIWVTQTIDYTLLGLGELPCKDTLSFIAVNMNESPYEGEFSATVLMEMYINFKELYLKDYQVADVRAKQSSDSVQFQLKPSELESLTKPKDLDPRLVGFSDAAFTMKTSGDMFESFLVVSPEGATQTHRPQMEAEWNTKVTQLDDKITIEIEMFGTFQGTIKHVKSLDELPLPPLELAPLVQ
jgi:hypothetical protein